MINTFNASFQSPSHLKSWSAGCLNYVPVINLLSFSSKCSFIVYFAIMELDPVNICPLPHGTRLSFISRRCWRDTGRGRSLSSWYQHVPLRRLLQPMAPLAPSFCRTWKPAARHTSPRAGTPLDSFTDQQYWCNTYQWMASLEPLQAASPSTWQGDSQSPTGIEPSANRSAT